MASGREHVSAGLAEDSFAIAPLRGLLPEARDEYRAALILRHTPRLGARSIAKLLHAFGCAAKALESVGEWGRIGISQACQDACRAGKGEKGAEREWQAAVKSGAAILLWPSAAYPPCLREISDAPPFLYLKGDTGLLSAPFIALVGSRAATPGGERLALAFGEQLADCGLTVVSGMAMGIDRFSHLGALAGAGKSLGVLGTGIDIEYPGSNRDVFARMKREGLLVSEFPPDMRPAAVNFPIRNRIISGLSLGVVVVEAAARSGSLITARLALEQNREVFAVPGPAMNATSQGCQNLVRQGARAVFSVSDIISDLAAVLKPYRISAAGGARPQAGESAAACSVPRTPATPGEEGLPLLEPAAQKAVSGLLAGPAGERILAALAGAPLGIDVLSEKTGLGPGEMNAAILGLEMAGRIKRLPGARYGLS